jgi:WhiB family redox-sensing transcriptional regulator
VRDECLQFAFKTNQESGIWGGTSEDERRRLRKSWLAARRQGVGAR